MTEEQKERLDAIQRMLRYGVTIDENIRANQVELTAQRTTLTTRAPSVEDLIKRHKRISELKVIDANLQREKQELLSRLSRAKETYERDYPCNKEQ